MDEFWKFFSCGSWWLEFFFVLLTDGMLMMLLFVVFPKIASFAEVNPCLLWYIWLCVNWATSVLLSILGVMFELGLDSNRVFSNLNLSLTQTVSKRARTWEFNIFELELEFHLQGCSIYQTHNPKKFDRDWLKRYHFD